MKILITGCRGQLGTELQHQLSAEGCAIGPLPERLRKRSEEHTSELQSR